MKIYIAAASHQWKMVRHFMQQLTDAGFTITFDWTRDVEKYGSEGKALSPSALKEIALRDLEGVRAADLVWFLGSDIKSEGRSFELGAAIALDKVTVWSGEPTFFSRLCTYNPASHANAYLAIRDNYTQLIKGDPSAVIRRPIRTPKAPNKRSN